MDADLYGDLDLEELDATALEEELEEPPEDGHGAHGQAGQASQPLQHQQQQQQQQQNVQQSYGQPAPQQNAFQGSSQPAQGGYQGQQQQSQQNQPQSADERLRSDAQDEGKMFIGGLNWETTDEGLKAYMSKFGHIDACTIMRDPTGRSRGFAFLTYSDPASVNSVLGQVHHLDGKQIDPKRAIPRAEHERTAKVFVGGLAPPVTSESLKTFLGQFGQVMDATVMYDRETGRSKGFAFATFADEESVTRAMENSGIELEGKQIEIKKAQPRGAGTLPNKFSGGSGGRFGNNAGGSGGMGGMGGMGGIGSMGGMGGAGAGGFDPSAMAMMYANMMKGMGGGMIGGGGFDPNAMAMMYSNMMKNMGGMGNAPAINPNMAMRGMGNMGGMGGMGMMGMGGMGGMGMMGMGGGMGGMGGGVGVGMGGGRGNGGRPIPNAPKGPAAMRGPSGSGGSDSGGATGVATPMSQQGQGGTGAQRYSTQGNARSRPY